MGGPGRPVPRRGVALPPGWRAEAFAGDDRSYRLLDAYRHGVEFECQDIRREMPDGPFDLILCCNLAFTYFDEPLQRRIAIGLRARLRPGGELIVGAHEQPPAQ